MNEFARSQYDIIQNETLWSNHLNIVSPYLLVIMVQFLYLGIFTVTGIFQTFALFNCASIISFILPFVHMKNIFMKNEADKFLTTLKSFNNIHIH